MDDGVAQGGVAMRTEERAAFDLWLNRSLVRQYEPALSEPVPDEMLRLLAGVPADPAGTRH